MYVIPLIVLALVIVVGTAWSPIFALIIAVPLFVLFLGYVGLSRQSDRKAATKPSGAPASGEGQGETRDTGGIWGERRA